MRGERKEEEREEDLTTILGNKEKISTSSITVENLCQPLWLHATCKLVTVTF